MIEVGKNRPPKRFVGFFLHEFCHERRDDPGVLAEFVLQLPTGPTRVAKESAQMRPMLFL